MRPPKVLALDLSVPVAEDPRPSLLNRLLSMRRPDLREVVDAIAEAGRDPRISALLVRVDHPADSWAHAEELRAAVTGFRSTGKQAIASAQSLGEAGNGTLAYYVAAAFDDIHLQPSGDVGITGPAAEVPFLAEFLSRTDITAEFDRRHEYKSAANLLTERGFTDAHREAVERIIASQHEQLVAAIATGRNLSAEQAAAVIEQGPRHAAAALAAGLVDRLAYRDETTALVTEQAGAGARLVTLRTYRALLRRRRLLPRRRTRIALVRGYGAINLGSSRRSPMGSTMGSDTVTQGFAQAVRDKRVRAILFRVDSPGGSAAASDAVWRAVVRAREAGKPVIVSMGSVAGSGGYWVSMGADRVLASPGTLTGSVGVVVGKLVVRGLLQRLGITTDEAHRGPFALMSSPNREFTPEQWEHIQSQLDRIYEEFVDKVAQSRDLPPDHVHEVARGRVWTGADAVRNGLADELGGYQEALAAIRRRLALRPDAPLTVRTFPRQSPLERIGLRRPDFPEAPTLAAAATEAVRLTGFHAEGTAAMPTWASRLR